MKFPPPLFLPFDFPKKRAACEHASMRVALRWSLLKFPPPPFFGLFFLLKNVQPVSAQRVRCERADNARRPPLDLVTLLQTHHVRLDHLLAPPL